MRLAVIFAIITFSIYGQLPGLGDGQGAFVLCDIVVIFYELICSSIYNRICYRAIANVCYTADCLDICNFAVNKSVASDCHNRTCKRIAVVGLACSFGCESNGARSDFQGVRCRRVTVVCHRRLNGDINFADVLYCGNGVCPRCAIVGAIFYGSAINICRCGFTVGSAVIFAGVILAGYGESFLFGNAERHGARLSYGLRTILRCVPDNAGYVVVISTYIRRSCSSCCSCRPSAGSSICFHDICTDNVIVFISDSVSDIYIVVLFTICKDVSLEHFRELIFNGKAVAVVGLAVFVRSAETIYYAYRNLGVLDRCNLFSFKSYVCTGVCRLSAAIGLSAIYGDHELDNELLAEVIWHTGMCGVGHKVCAVVKAAYSDCIARNLDIAGEVFPVAKCLALAVIVCGVDFNVCGIFGNIEIRRDIIRQDGVTAKINAGLADGFAKLSKHIAERVCIACNFVEAILYGSVCAGFTHAACIRIVGRDKVHVAICIFVAFRKRRTYICSAENTNGIYRCAVGLALESLCVLYCIICNFTIKAVDVIRFTICEHNDNTIAVFRHLVSIAKYIDCFFKAVVSRCCALSA